MGPETDPSETEHVNPGTGDGEEGRNTGEDHEDWPHT